MRHLLTCAFVALVAAAQAALPTSGLSNTEYPVVIHLSVEDAAKTKVGKIFLAEAEKKESEPEGRKTVEKLGIRTRDLRDITVLIKPGQNGEAIVVGMARGTFDKARIESFATLAGVTSKTFSGLKGWDANQLTAATSGAKAPESAAAGDSAYLIVVDNTTLLFASDEAALADAAATLKANKPWNNPGLTAALSSVTHGWIGLSADVLAVESEEAKENPEAKPSGAKTATLALGENATDLQVRVAATFVSEAKATEGISQLKGLLGFAQIGLMPSADDTPEQAKQKGDTLALVQRLKVEQKGANGSISLDYPSDKAGEFVAKQIAEAVSTAGR